MTYVYGNRVSFLTSTTGTGTISIGSPVTDFQLPAGASNIISGSLVGYTIIDGTNWEVGTGTYTSGSPPTLSRTTVEDSSSGPGVLQNLDGNAIVSFVVTAAMYTSLAPLASPALTGTPTAPTATAGTNTTQIATTAFVAPSFNDIGRNKVHNPLFNIAQRGAGAFTTGYTVDRWYLAVNLDTSSVTQLQFSDAQRTTIGDEEAYNCIAVAINGNAGAGAFTIVYQPIENVRRLSNKTVTVSFWAYATSGTPEVGVGLRQYMGTGGSPSGNVDINATAVTLSSTLTRYSVTITLGSLSGLTLGTNNDHYTRLAFFFSSGSTNNALAGGIGVQTGTTVVMWGIQLEIGSTTTQLEKPDPRFDLANCQRFFQYHTAVLVEGYNTTGLPAYIDFTYPVTMRAVPTAAYDTITYSNASAMATNVAETSHIRISVTITATNAGFGSGNMGLSADL